MSQAAHTHTVKPLFGDEKPFYATAEEVESMQKNIVGFKQNYTVTEIQKPAKPAELAEAPAKSKTAAAEAEKGGK